MEGLTPADAHRLAGYQAAHPHVEICRVDRCWHAWVPDGEFTGGEVHAATVDELLGKLAG